jgi:hypothetical protein
LLSKNKDKKKNIHTFCMHVPQVVHTMCGGEQSKTGKKGWEAAAAAAAAAATLLLLLLLLGGCRCCDCGEGG